jgi:hypothetical protein
VHFECGCEIKVEFSRKPRDAKIQQKSRSAEDLTIYNAAIGAQVKKTPHDVRKKQSSIVPGFFCLPVNFLVLA